jgi:hypothetical protein
VLRNLQRQPLEDQVCFRVRGARRQADLTRWTQ